MAGIPSLYESKYVVAQYSNAAIATAILNANNALSALNSGNAYTVQTISLGFDGTNYVPFFGYTLQLSSTSPAPPIRTRTSFMYQSNATFATAITNLNTDLVELNTGISYNIINSGWFFDGTNYVAWAAYTAQI